MLLLQQLTVDAIDLLDPDCVRLPLDRRVRLRPISYGPLPAVTLYQTKLKAVANALTFEQHVEGLNGLRDLMRSFDETPPSATGAATGPGETAGAGLEKAVTVVERAGSEGRGSNGSTPQ